MRKATLIIAWGICVSFAQAQSSPGPGPGAAQFPRFPFDKWAAENARPQIAWDVTIRPPQLSAHQRLVVYLGAMIRDMELRKHQDEAQLLFLVRIEDSKGHRYEAIAGAGLSNIPGSPPPHIAAGGFPGGGNFHVLEYNVSAFVLPDDYVVSLAICDKSTLEHSFVRRHLHVAAIGHDPLPGAWSGLPAIEFLPAAQRDAAWSVPVIATGIRMSVRTQHPVRVELLVNTTPSVLDSANMFRQNMSLVAASLKALTGIDPIGGSVGLTVVDVNRRVVSYQQPDLRALDWVELRRALSTFNAGSIDAGTLVDQSKMLDYFAGEVKRRLAPADLATDVSRVLIVLSAPVYFKQQDLPPVYAYPPDPGRRIFYIRAYPGFWSAPLGLLTGPGTQLPSFRADDIENLLKPMGARIFRVERPEEFRKALAAILEDISKIP